MLKAWSWVRWTGPKGDNNESLSEMNSHLTYFFVCSVKDFIVSLLILAGRLDNRYPLFK